mmetsp:Transcript_12725/g.34705  ORF Transcript_12725/g.34705 Transcript_12725/m.34705 type:complete len:529 (+) Transcript_12725:68-1654(+)
MGTPLNLIVLVATALRCGARQSSVVDHPVCNVGCARVGDHSLLQTQAGYSTYKYSAGPDDHALDGHKSVDQNGRVSVGGQGAAKDALGQVVIEKEEEEEEEKLEGGSVHGLAWKHRSSSAQWQGAEEVAVQKHEVLMELEKRSALAQGASEEPYDRNTQPIEYHKNASSHYQQLIGENATKCQECARAEQALIAALQAARAAHTTAQTRAVALATAIQVHAVASQAFTAAEAAYTALNSRICPITLTYEDSEEEHSAVVSLTQQLYPKAREAVQAKAWRDANKTSMDNAQSAYDAAASAAETADLRVATKRAEEESACVGYGGLVPTPAPDTTALYVKVTVVFGLHSGRSTLDGVEFFDAEGLKISASVVNYQDEHNSGWPSCALNDGDSRCWYEGFHNAPVIGEPIGQCADIKNGDFQGNNRVTTQGASHECTCVNGKYKGHTCRTQDSYDAGCHWFLFQLEREAQVSRIQLTQGCGYPAALSYVEVSACTSADVTTCNDEILGSGTRASADQPMDFDLGQLSAGAL